MRTYFEPFLGGGALFFDLKGTLPFLKWAGGKRSSLDEIRPFVFGKYDRYVLSDTNTRLIRTYRAVRDNVEEVIEILREMSNCHKLDGSKEYFLAVREFDVDALTSDTRLAGWFIYLNKTAFNGLYRVNKKGKFNTPYGKYKNPAICDETRLRAASKALQGVELSDRGFEHVLESAQRDDTVYCDPPYIPRTNTANFTSYDKGGFDKDKQTLLRDTANMLRNRGSDVLVSNSDVTETRDLYKTWETKEIKIARAISAKSEGRVKVGELLIYSNESPTACL